jgi:alkylhydroperoxidase family enzyme
MAAHTALARQLGVSEALLDALYHIDTHRHLFTARELVALRLAEIMTTSARDVDEALWDELQTHFDDGELVELVTVIGLFNFFNRFADALQILPQQ